MLYNKPLNKLDCPLIELVKVVRWKCHLVRLVTYKIFTDSYEYTISKVNQEDTSIKFLSVLNFYLIHMVIWLSNKTITLAL